MRFFLLSTLSLLILSCQKTPTTAILAGRLEGMESGYLILNRSADRYGHRDWLSSLDTVTVGQDGSFSFEVTITEPDFFQVCDANGYQQCNDIFLAAGDSVFVSRSLMHDRNIFRYSGSRAGAYDYYSVRDSLRSQAPQFVKKDRAVFYVSSMDSLDMILQSQLQWEKDLIDGHFGKHADWQPIAGRMWDERRYEVYDQYFRYLYYHNYYVQDTFLYIIPDTAFYDFLRDADLSSCPERYMWQYQTFISDYVQDRFEHAYRELPDSVKWENYLKLSFEIIKKHLSGIPRDAALFALTNDFSQALESAHFFEVLATITDYFRMHHSSELYYNAFLAVSGEFEKLKTGSAAPDLALPDINGDTIRFSDLKGKVVYVDFWGTWCYPCLQELPHSLALQDTFEGQDVEFVYIALESGDEQLAEWRDFISGKRSFDYAPFLNQQVYPGIHLLSDGQFGNPQLKPFKINSAPTYMLIDKEGNFARSRAPRPSDPEIKQVIASLLD